MNKKFLLGAGVLLLAGIGLAIFLSQDIKPGNQGGYTEKDITQKRADLAAQSGQTNVPTQAVLVPLDLSHPVRLAIGGLGLAKDDDNRQLGDLVTAALTGEPGFNLVERQSLAAILRELNLSWSGFVRAKDAVRAGKLLKADWFLLGTRAKIDGTNSIVVRVVDARTGIMREAGVCVADKPATELAADLAAFLRQCRQNAAQPKPCVYLAVGAFEDLSVNNRQADFPTQLRGYLTAAYRGGAVTLLEREYVEMLLREVHLDMAGLTEESWSNSPPAMQSAYWLVTGQYQSYETTNMQVEVNLELRRVFGKSWHRTLRGLPGEPIGRQIKLTLDQISGQNTNPVTPTRSSEARVQLDIGKDYSGVRGVPGFPGAGDYELVWLPQSWESDPDPEQAAKQKRNLEEAMRALETVLLLEPTNNEARMYLAACLRSHVNYHPDEARNYYGEVIEAPVQDKWSALAQSALERTFERYKYSSWPAPTLEEEARWYEAAALHATNPPAVEFFRRHAEAARAGLAEPNDPSQMLKGAEDALLPNITNDWIKEMGGDEVAGIYRFVEMFGTNQAAAAQRLGELYPGLKARAPELAPYLLAQFVTVQVDTNAPLVLEFQRIVDQYAPQPDQVFEPEKFWWHIWPAYKWCCSHQLYGPAVKLLEGKLGAAALYPKHVWGVNSTDRLGLAYAYLGAQQWEQALAIFETFSNQAVRMQNEGPWGDFFTTTFPSKQADYCRQKLGLAVAHNPLEFSMAKPLLCLCNPSTLLADDNGLWIGSGGQLLHLDFGLRTNLVINLPMDPYAPITALGLTASNLWIATYGQGLIEFDKASRKCRRFTEKDGMMMDNLASLCLIGNTLWIGYGQRTSDINLSGQPVPGGLGCLDLTSGRFTSFTPSLPSPEDGDKEKPTRHTVMTITPGIAGDVWFVTDEDPGNFLHCYQSRKSLWTTSQFGCTALGANEQQMVLATFSVPLSRYNFQDGQWRSLKAGNQLPSKLVSTLTFDGKSLWVGGLGYVAQVDPIQDKVLHFANVQAKTVDRIQIAGGYVWAQFDCHLYRALLSALQ